MTNPIAYVPLEIEIRVGKRTVGTGTFNLPLLLDSEPSLPVTLSADVAPFKAAVEAMPKAYAEALREAYGDAAEALL